MKKLVQFIVTPALLLLLGIVLAFLFYKESYITTIQVHDAPTITDGYLDKPLLKGQVIRGQFNAPYNNLGAFEFRVHTYNRINDDTIHFRLREKGSPVWVVQNAYVVDRFPDNLLYGFGFPPITNSQGKTYEFELSSDRGIANDAIGFSAGFESAASQYIFNRASITHNAGLVKYFITEKLHSLLSDPYFLAYSVIFLMPLFAYLLIFGVKNVYILYTLEFISFLYMIAAYITLPIAIAQDTILYIYLYASAVLVVNVSSFLVRRVRLPKQFTSADAFSVAICLALLLIVSISFQNDLMAMKVAISLFYTIVFALILAARELYKGK